jgi:hypothetical protein
MHVATSFSWIAMGMILSHASMSAEIVDRVDIVVNGQAIKESDILNEIRLTDFLNRTKLDLGLAAQKEAASRLIDQKLIRDALKNGIYPPPDPAEAERLKKQIRGRASDDAAYRRGLTAYGITDEMLQEHLLWQIAVLQFISLRFHVPSDNGSAATGTDAVNQQFFAWLDQSRKDARIEFKRMELQ